MRTIAALFALLPFLALADVAVTYTGSQTTYNLRSGSTILSRHASLSDALDAAQARGPGTYSVTQPTATVTVTPPPCVYSYSAWSPTTCPAAGKQTRSIASTSPATCTPTAQLPLEQACAYVPPAVAVTLTATPAVLTPGAAATLTWSSKAASCTFSSLGQSLVVPAAGSRSTGPLQATTTIKITCGAASQSVTITVVTPPPPPPPPPPVASCVKCGGQPITITRATTYGLIVTAANCCP